MIRRASLNLVPLILAMPGADYIMQLWADEPRAEPQHETDPQDTQASRTWETTIKDVSGIKTLQAVLDSQGKETGKLIQMTVHLGQKIPNDCGTIRGLEVGDRRYDFPVSIINGVRPGEMVERLTLSYFWTR